MVRWICPNLPVTRSLRSPHSAANHLTRTPPGGVSPDAGGAAPSSGWRPSGLGRTVSAATLRRGLRALDGVWKRAQRVANDTAPPRVERLARIRLHGEPLAGRDVRGWAEARDRPLRPNVG